MPRYHYIAVDPSAATVRGDLEAQSKSAAVERLHAVGQVPIRIEEAGGLLFAELDLAALFRRRRLPVRTLALITGQLATLLHAGLALDEALGILEDLVEAAQEKECLRALRHKVRGGATLADAMAAQHDVFPAFYVSMVRAGEAGASLDATLERLAEFLHRSQAAKEHVRSALLYPAVVMATCCVSIGVLFTVVVPRFRPLFEQAGDSLPTSARSLLIVSDLFAHFWWAAALLAGAAVLLAHRLLKHPAHRQSLDRLALRLPLLGQLIAKVEVARFARTLGALLRNGVPLLSALAITRETVGNRVFFEAMGPLMERVKTGRGLAEPLKEAKVFPPLAVHLIRVGEESGRQEEMLVKIADIFEAETHQSIDRLLSLLAPALTVLLGVIVAAVIGSILTAVLSVYDLAM